MKLRRLLQSSAELFLQTRLLWLFALLMLPVSYLDSLLYVAGLGTIDKWVHFLMSLGALLLYYIGLVGTIGVVQARRLNTTYSKDELLTDVRTKFKSYLGFIFLASFVVVILGIITLFIWFGINTTNSLSDAFRLPLTALQYFLWASFVTFTSIGTAILFIEEPSAPEAWKKAWGIFNQNLIPVLLITAIYWALLSSVKWLFGILGGAEALILGLSIMSSMLLNGIFQVAWPVLYLAQREQE